MHRSGQRINHRQDGGDLNMPSTFNPGQVDVLILSYNNGPWLKEAIESALAQTYQNRCITVYDDCSTDNTAEVMAAFAKTAPEVNYVRWPNNIGEGLSTRAAYQNCQGEFIAVLHGDDSWHSRYLESLVQEGLLAHPQCTFAYALWSRLENNISSPCMHLHIPRDNQGVKNVLGHLCLTNWILPSFLVFRREAFLKAGGSERFFNKKLSPTTGPFGDHYTVARLSTLGPCFGSNQRLGHYRIHPQQSSNLIWNRSLHSADRIIDMYDAIFFDKDLFSVTHRYMAKANVMGRIMTDVGVLETAKAMLDSRRVGPALAEQKHAFMQLLIDTLDDLVYDAAPEHPRHQEKFASQAQINEARLALQDNH